MFRRATVIGWVWGIRKVGLTVTIFRYTHLGSQIVVKPRGLFKNKSEGIAYLKKWWLKDGKKAHVTRNMRLLVTWLPWALAVNLSANDMIHKAWQPKPWNLLADSRRIRLWHPLGFIKTLIRLHSKGKSLSLNAPVSRELNAVYSVKLIGTTLLPDTECMLFRLQEQMPSAFKKGKRQTKREGDAGNGVSVKGPLGSGWRP